MKNGRYHFQNAGAEARVEHDPVTGEPFNPNQLVVYLRRDPTGVPIDPITRESLDLLRENSEDGRVTNPYYANQQLVPEVVQRLLNVPSRYYPPGDVRRQNLVPAEAVGGAKTSYQRKRDYKMAKETYRLTPTSENFRRYKTLKRLYRLGETQY
jgi:hypothetical protein